MGTLLNAVIIKSGQTVNFDNTSMDNYYSFVMNSAGKVLINGTIVNNYKTILIKEILCKIKSIL